MTQVLWLDWGGVLIQDPAETLRLWIAQYIQVSESQLDLQSWNFALEQVAQGLWCENDQWDYWSQKLHLPRTKFPTDLWFQAVQATFVFREEIWDLIPKLRAKGWQVGLFSNTEPGARDYLLKTGRDQYFDAIALSFELHLLKPHPEIYELVQKMLPAQQIHFIDDRIANIHRAQQKNWNCLCSSNSQSIYGWIQNLAALD